MVLEYIVFGVVEFFGMVMDLFVLICFVIIFD